MRDLIEATARMLAAQVADVVSSVPGIAGVIANRSPRPRRTT